MYTKIGVYKNRSWRPPGPQMATNDSQQHQCLHEITRGGHLGPKWPKMIRSNINAYMKLLVEATWAPHGQKWFAATATERWLWEYQARATPRMKTAANSFIRNRVQLWGCVILPHWAERKTSIGRYAGTTSAHDGFSDSQWANLGTKKKASLFFISLLHFFIYRLNIVSFINQREHTSL